MRRNKMQPLKIASFFLLFSLFGFCESKHNESKLIRPVGESNPWASFEMCQKQIGDLVEQLNCKIPPILYLPGMSLKRNLEYYIQFYAARNGVTYDQLNTLANLTQSKEGKKELSYFFTGLKCAGLPGDPIDRKNWKSYVPSCPPSSPKSPPWHKDNKWGTANYHPGADHCLRLGASRPKDCNPKKTLWQCIGKDWFSGLNKNIAEFLMDTVPSQQCCYDSENNLITKGAAAGTPDTVFRNHSVEDMAQKHFLKLEAQGRTLKVAELEKELEKNKLPIKDIKESIAHHILDARIIDACFPEWPGKNDESVKIYQSLGWSPTD